MTSKPQLLFILLLSFILVACIPAVDDPKTVADKYWQYLQTGNTTEAKKLLSSDSYQAFSEHSSRINSNTKLENSEAKTLVTTTITTFNPATSHSHTETFDTVLVLQQGQWKIDIKQSQIPPPPSAQEEKIQQLTEDLSESMQENIESIDDAMSKGMQTLNEALRDGSKEMGDSLLQLMNELNHTMQQSIDKMKERREQQMQEQEQQQPSQPDPRQGEGMI
jgi:ribosomal protein S20